eukprot:c3826_g1_i1.p1 GENE.c3826_g1_i1~~c3826_g1_i1.p1  ORF type:complete len:288 (+),score=153.68 c3826_g1_i1:48-911(+)
MSKKLVTLKDLEDQNSHDSDDERQGYYAGGGERSGQVILGDSKKKKEKGKNDDIYNQVFESARQMGATSESSETKPTSFSGSGRSLGSDSQGLPAHQVDPQVIRHTITIYKNGFVVDDGELRSDEVPENRMILEMIMRGQVPRQLLDPHNHSKEVEVKLVDSRDQEYNPPKHTPAFSGAGLSLRSATTSSSSSSSSSSSLTTPTPVTLDSSLPSLPVSFRLENGTRVTQNFNPTHTVGDVYGFVATQLPENRPFELICAFPKKTLTDKNQTVEEAGLKGSMLTQRFL